MIFSSPIKIRSVFLNIVALNIKINKQNLEAAVITEKEIEYLNSYDKIDQFIDLYGFYHLNICMEDGHCFICKFKVNVRYLYLEENFSDNKTGFRKIQNFGRLNFGNFFSMRIFLNV